MAIQLQPLIKCGRPQHIDKQRINGQTINFCYKFKTVPLGRIKRSPCLIALRSFYLESVLLKQVGHFNLNVAHFIKLIALLHSLHNYKYILYN